MKEKQVKQHNQRADNGAVECSTEEEKGAARDDTEMISVVVVV